MTVMKSSLDRAIRQAIDEGRIGRPKFIRCISTVGVSLLETEMAELTSLVTGWFGAQEVDSFSQGDGEASSTRISKWADGQGSLLIVSTVPVLRGPTLDVMVVGSNGSIYFEE